MTTNYLVDTQNPTGYAQVIDEVQNGAVTRTYGFGLERIDENQIISSAWTASFYGYDGHGSVRQLTNSTGSVTDSYDYDAFGNLINFAGSTPNIYLFAGEQFDPALGLYYNRARYYNNTTGRFWTTDTAKGQDQQPLTLHKYLYADANPVDGIDPSGNQDSLAELSVEESVSMTINSMPTLQVPHAAAYPVLVVTLPNGNSYEPESQVKNPKQASISKVPLGMPIRIAVPDSVDPQALVNEWRGKLRWWNAPVTYARFGWYWRPGGPHDYKQGPGNAIYDAFGNFEFGATGAAAGFDEQTLEEAAAGVKGGSNNVINELDIDQGFLAIEDGATLSKRVESLSPL